MLEQLFGSKTRLDLLRLFVKNSTKVFFVRELSRKLDIQVNSIRRELENLIEAGIVQKTEQPREVDTSEPGASLRKYYGIDTNAPLYDELQNLILKEQVLNEQELIQDLTDNLEEEISFLLVTGKFTSGEDTPTDMLLVGEVAQSPVKEEISDYEDKFDSEIKYTIMEEEEFKERHQIMDKFLYSLFESDNVKVINELNV